MNLTRRSVLAMAAATAFVKTPIARAQSSEPVVGVSWGGPWLDALKPLAAAWEKQTGKQVIWEAHEGGASSAVAAKIRAAWPNPKHDVVHANDPVIHTMAAEGWLEPLDGLPSLKNIPERYIIRNENGQAISAPHYLGLAFWGYRTDLVSQEINSLSDVLGADFDGGIGLRAPTLWSGLPLVSLALERGGNEQNIDPAFALLKEMAQTGKVSGVFTSAVDTVNSVARGETAITLASHSEWRQIAKVAPVKVLNRAPAGGALKTFHALGHFVVIKSKHSAAAKELVEYLITPEPDQTFATAIGSAPSNRLAKFDDTDGYFLAPNEVDKFGYFPDYKLMSKQGQAWNERFNGEIQPLLRG